MITLNLTGDRKISLKTEEIVSVLDMEIYGDYHQATFKTFKIKVLWFFTKKVDILLKDGFYDIKQGSEVYLKSGQSYIIHMSRLTVLGLLKRKLKL